MTTYWTLWVIVIVLLTFATMYYVISHFYRRRESEDADVVVAEFDGIEERDGPVPKLLWLSYWLGLAWAIGYFIYMPALGGFAGLGNFQADDGLDANQFEQLDVLLAGVAPGAVPDLASLAENSTLVASGYRVFKNHCIGCHGDTAQGQRMFPSLTDNEWLYGASDAQLWHSIAEGRKAAMPGWDLLLEDEQIDDLVDYLVSLNSDRLPLSTRFDVSSGQRLYYEHCADCHAIDASGNQQIGAPNLADDIWLYGGGKTEIKNAIQYGLNGEMPGFAERLATSELIAVAAYVKHLALQGEQPHTNGALIARGKYLTRMGDCIACHTAADGGEPMAGGLQFKLPPMGIINSTNLSPHPATGVGAYTYDEFYSAMKQGKGRHGYLYPAMPYTSYKFVSDADLEAIWAYLRSVTPIDRPNATNGGLFRFDVRIPLLFWSMAFRGTDTLDYGDNPSSEWRRGKYLVMGLGHCGECHTPRNLAQAMVWDQAFKGNIIEGWQAPDISADMLFRQGWTEQELVDFLTTGRSAQGSAFAGMAEVVANSTRYLTDADARAIARYLLEGDALLGNTLDPHSVPIERPGLTSAARADKAYAIFKTSCGACHGQQGRASADLAPALNRNSIFSLDDPFNSVAVVLRGLPANDASLEGNHLAMIRFNENLTDTQIAKLVTFVRTYFGGQPDVVAPGDVERIRRALDKGGFTPQFHREMARPERIESM